MKKLILLLVSTLTIGIFSSSALAVEAEGTVDEIRVCGFSYNSWRNLTYFKLSSGDWFYILTNDTANPADDNATLSVVMSAYASRYKVKVNANWTHHPYSNERCGISGAVGFWNNDGDYIALKEYSE